MFILFVIYTLYSVSHLINAWGREGHHITARVALLFLDADGEQLLSDLLPRPGEKLEDVIYDAAVWADTVRNVTKYEFSKNFHFINIPYRLCDGFKLNRDCDTALGPNTCTVVSIGKFIDQVKDVSLPDEERADSLKFLIHFIADMYQPLHVAFAADRGGSKIEVYPPWDHPVTKSGKVIVTPLLKPLHVLWDTHIIQYLMAKKSMSWTQLADTAASASSGGKPQKLSYSIPRYSDIVNESADLSCNKAYKHDSGGWLVSGTHLSTRYYEDSSQIILDQLVKAGKEIANIVNQVGREINEYIESVDTMSIASTVDTSSGYITDESGFSESESMISEGSGSSYYVFP